MGNITFFMVFVMVFLGISWIFMGFKLFFRLFERFPA